MGNVRRAALYYSGQHSEYLLYGDRAMEKMEKFHVVQAISGMSGVRQRRQALGTPDAITLEGFGTRSASNLDKD